VFSLGYVSRLLRNLRRAARYKLADDADLTIELIERIESHVRWFAVWLGSPARHARINAVTVCPGKTRGYI
jgi:hypothetical protein